MLRRLVGFVWRALPREVRRGGVWLWEPRFMVTAGAVVLDGRGRVLLLKHVFRRGSGWGIPGGFLEKGEQPEAGLRRELREETGVEVTDVEMVFARTLRQPQQVEIIYCCRALEYNNDDGVVRPQSIEIKSAGWFAPDALPSEVGRTQRQLIERALHVYYARRGKMAMSKADIEVVL